MRPYGSLVLQLAAIATVAASCPAQTTTRVSLSSAGQQANGDVVAGPVSRDGRFVTLESGASNLVPEKTNGFDAIYVRDRKTGATTWESVTFDGSEPDGDSFYSAVSADGRFVAFSSRASNLVTDDTNGVADVFVRDRLLGTTTRVSVDSNGVQGDGPCGYLAISPDGRYVAFESAADNLVPNDTNGAVDVFVHDLVTHTTRRVSVDSNGVEGNADVSAVSISAGGRYVAFASGATNLVPGDTNGRFDVFVHDCTTGTTERVSVDSNGEQGIGGNYGSFVPNITPDGRYVTFYSDATNLVADDTNGLLDVFVHDRLTGVTTRESVDSNGVEGNGYSANSSLSDDGRFVVFYSLATNLVADDTNGKVDVFLRDRTTGQTSRVSVDTAGNQGDGDCTSDFSAISGDGRSIVFTCRATNFDLNDTNGLPDAYVRDRYDLGPLPPTADAGFDQTVVSGALVTLDGSGSDDPNWDALTYAWSQVAGPAVTLDDATSMLPSFVAPTVGAGGATLTFQLVVNDGTFSSGPATVDVFVQNVPASTPPTAVAGPDQSIHAGQVVHLDGSGSFDDDTPTSDLVYAWTIASAPTGSTASLAGAATETPSFVPDLPGTYVVELTVTDLDGLTSAPSFVHVSSLDQPPTARAGTATTAVVGSLVSLDGSGSMDPDQDPITYQWSFQSRPNGSAASLANPTSSRPTFVPDVAGSYTLQLVVNDSFSSSVPSLVVVTAITPVQYAEVLVLDATTFTAALPTSSVTNAGNKQALGNTLVQAQLALQSGNYRLAQQKLEDAITRTDGWVLRGRADTNGPGRDWIVEQAASVTLYVALTTALHEITP